MYLIYFYSNETDDIIPKMVIDNLEDVRRNIMKIIYDIIVFEEGKKKADEMIIFNNNEKILFDGLDNGIYIKVNNNRYNIFKKTSKYITQNGWFSSYNTTIYDNALLGYLSFLSIPDKDCINQQTTNIENKINIPRPSLIINKPIINKSTISYQDVIFELKNKVKLVK